jgi:myo-inositol-1(or 4)-monophosphatase
VGSGFSERTQLAMAVAAAGGRLLETGATERARQDFVQVKSSRELVTALDRRVESMAVEMIRSRFPADAVKGEEGAEAGAGSGEAACWLVDPIDGTFNFVRDIPAYCVSVAYLLGGRLHGGAVYDPVRDELFVAERGRGAYLNGQPISVSGARRSQDCLLAVFFPAGPDGYLIASHFELFGHILPEIRDIRRVGAAALDLAWVACGRLDGSFEVHLHPWDIAAGIVLVEEAGGLVTDWHGGADYLRSGSIVATNGHIHSWLLDKIERHFVDKDYID